MTDRISREKEFHNNRFAENTRKPLDKYYSVSQNTRKLFLDLMEFDLNGKTVLEYGCGEGSFSFDLANKGSHVHGIDISEVAIETANRKAIALGLENKIDFKVMNAEELDFKDNYFDRICGNSILHHLELKKSLIELTRVLKADGNAVFIEPLGHNPFINLYRKLTPKLRSEDEHPLKSNDLKLFKEHFAKVEINYFHFTTLLAVPFRNSKIFRGLFAVLSKIDSFLFKSEMLKKNAWMVVLALSNPNKQITP